MTLEELITDLKAAGANENTLRLALNCYQLGRVNEREACAKMCDSIAERANGSHTAMADDRNDEPILYLTGKELGASNCASAIRARGQA